MGKISALKEVRPAEQVMSYDYKMHKSLFGYAKHTNFGFLLKLVELYLLVEVDQFLVLLELCFFKNILVFLAQDFFFSHSLSLTLLDLQLDSHSHGLELTLLFSLEDMKLLSFFAGLALDMLFVLLFFHFIGLYLHSMSFNVVLLLS